VEKRSLKIAKTFSISFTGDPASLLADAHASAQQNDVQFIGDTQRGSFSGQGIEGSYEISGNIVNVTIDKKPFFVPWALVEAQLEQFFQ
jgi:hypothetical protein